MSFFGDSHTAGDAMTSRIRLTFQKRFGDAGRGLVAAGRPTAKHYYQRDIRYGASGQWRSAIGGNKDPEPYGIAGLRVYGEKQGAQLWVETCSDCPSGNKVAQMEVLYQAAPERGVLKLRVDSQPWKMLSTKTTAIEPPHPARHVIVVPDGPHRLTIEHGGSGLVDLYGVVFERLRPGVIVESLGVVGRRLGSLRSWDWSIIGEQLATRDPRLVVLQYGTNESDDPDLDLEDLARYYDDTIKRIKAAAPQASIIILGPPDVGTREAGKACDKKQGREGDPSGDAAAPKDAGVIPECEWRTPAVLREIIAVEHAAALRNKVVFFDTFAAMGGADRMDGWHLKEPKLAYKDRVHFTDAGYALWAETLSTALLAQYDHWRRRNPGGPSPGGPNGPSPAMPASPVAP
jgi:lysophospholipase L1-like esterase